MKSAHEVPSWRTRLAQGLLIAGACGGVLISMRMRDSERSPEADAPGLSRSNISHTATSVPSPVQERIGKVVAVLRQPMAGAAVSLQLLDLRRALGEAPAGESARAIREFLRSGEDVSTGLSFQLGAAGRLDEPPSLRLFLLDYLSEISPDSAAAAALEILSTRTSAEEWAICLRNLARARQDADARGVLTAKLREMLAFEPWVSQQSDGFLEALDVAVYLGGAEMVNLLVQLTGRDGALAHAGELALERLVIRDPHVSLTALQQVGLNHGKPVFEAGLYARADLRDPQGVAVIEKYLLDTSRTTEELAQFAELFPNENYRLGHRLLTANDLPDRNDVVARDRAALQAIRKWLEDPRFVRIQPQLRTMHNRLVEFVNQAARGDGALPAADFLPPAP